MIDVEPEVTQRPAGRRRMLSLAVLVALLGVTGGFVALRLFLPLPAPKVTQTIGQQYQIPGDAPVLPWPDDGQAAVAVDGLGSLGSSGEEKPVPIASVAKIMTAYQVLQDHPIGANDAGPSLTVTAEEAAAYPAQLASGQSLVPVQAGEVLTERQALQALLLPSANNMAYILARWDAGGRDAFLAKMNQTAAMIGMTHTKYTDPSGLDPTTVSTAIDQVTLARKAIAVPALAQVVSMKDATLPVAGPVRNVNSLLGQDGINGIKTGSTDQAGGCLVFSAKADVNGRPFTIVGAVLGPGPTMALAFSTSQQLVRAARDAVHPFRVVNAGQQVADVNATRGRSTKLVAAGDVDVLGWPGLTYKIATHASVPNRVGAGQSVGTVDLTADGATASTGARTTSALTPPGFWDRLVHG